MSPSPSVIIKRDKWKVVRGFFLWTTGFGSFISLQEKTFGGTCETTNLLVKILLVAGLFAPLHPSPRRHYWSHIQKFTSTPPPFFTGCFVVRRIIDKKSKVNLKQQPFTGSFRQMDINGYTLDLAPYFHVF